jgi:hypothetical protein
MPPRPAIRDVVAALGDRASPTTLPSGYGRAAIDAAVAAGEIRYRPDGTLEATPRRGRPPSAGETASARIDLRATPAQVKRWRAAAEAAGMGLRDWIRAQADAACGRAKPQ